MRNEVPWDGNIPRYFKGNQERRLLMFGGFGASAVPLGRFCRAMNEKTGADVCLTSLPGHGEGEPLSISASSICLEAGEDLEAFSHGGKVIVGGFSFGAVVAASLAKEFPEKVAGVLLLSPVIEHRSLQRTASSLAMIGAKYVAYLSLLSLPLLALGGRKKTMLGAMSLAATAFVAGNLRKDMGTHLPYDFSDEVVEFPHHTQVTFNSAASLLPVMWEVRNTNLSIPTCVINGNQDPYVTAEAIRKFALQHASPSGLLLDRCGHRVMTGVFEKPCIAAAARFCNEVWVGQ